MAVPGPGPGVRVRRVEAGDVGAFVAAARRSRRLHDPWVVTPTTREAFERYLKSHDGATAYAFVVETAGPDGAPDLAGYINIRHVERDPYQRGVLGFAAFEGFQGQGHMSAGLAELICIAFGELGLRRLEAEVQPGNKPSRALVRKLGFRYEGYSPGLILIGDEWKGHQRWAIDAPRRRALDDAALPRITRLREWVSWKARMPDVPARSRVRLIRSG